MRESTLAYLTTWVLHGPAFQRSTAGEIEFRPRRFDILIFFLGGLKGEPARYRIVALVVLLRSQVLSLKTHRIDYAFTFLLFFHSTRPRNDR